MYEETALSLLSQMPETKTEIEKFSKLVMEKIDLGEMRDVLTFAARFKALETLKETLFSNVLFKDALLEAAEKYGKTFHHRYATFTTKETGATYDFSVCCDSEWEQLKAEQTKINDRLKAREAFLKTIPADSEVFGSDGVQLQLPIKKSTTMVTIALDK